MDVDKDRIRLEEIYRDEVRRELETRKAQGHWRTFGRILNSPFAIWILTSVGIGLVSFFYSQWTEDQSARSAAERQATKVFFEAQFRIRQMDEILEKVRGNFSDDQETPTDEMLSLFVGIQLSGVTSFPLSDEMNVWVNGHGTGNRRLPAGRGYQDRDFQGYSLLNLWYIYHALTCDMRPSDERVANLTSQFQDLRKLVQDKVHRGQALKIIEQAGDVWSDTKSELAIFLHPGPRFDQEKHCE